MSLTGLTDEYAPASLDPPLEAVSPPTNYGEVRIIFWLAPLANPIISVSSITEPFQSEESIGQGIRTLLSNNGWISTEDGVVINCDAVVAAEVEILTKKEHR